MCGVVTQSDEKIYPLSRLDFDYVTTAQIQQESQRSCTVGLGMDGVINRLSKNRL